MKIYVSGYYNVLRVNILFLSECQNHQADSKLRNNVTQIFEICNNR